MSTISFVLIFTIIAYLLVMLAVGFICSKSNGDATDFYLGGRKMGPLVTAMSAEASDMSSWLLMGLPGLAYLSGICEPIWTALGLGIGTYLNWFFVAKRLRRYSANLNAYTIPQFFSKRFHDEDNILSALAAVIIILFFVPYTASGFAACGKLFQSLFGVNYYVAMCVSAFVIIAYTVLGGFKAVSQTDFIQSCVMTLALFVVLGFGIYHAGGVGAVIDNAKVLSGQLSLTLVHDLGTNSAKSYGGVIAIISTLAWGLGYFGMPHILLRFMAIEDENKLKISRRVASVWVFIAMGLAIFIGIMGISFTKNGMLPQLDTSSKAETLIVMIANLISQNGIFAAVVAGLILAGVLAATMSTADSQMLAAGSSVSENIIGEFFGKKLTDKQSMLIARISIIVIGLFGIAFAIDPESSVFRIVSFAWAGFGGAFGALVLLALFWKRTNKVGAIVGMAVGGLTVLIWKFFVRPLGGVWDIYELLPAFVLSLLSIVVVSLLTAQPEPRMIEEFEAAKGDK